MTPQADLFRDIEKLPPKYFSEVIDFVGYLHYKTQQESTIKTAQEDKFTAFLQLRGIHKNIPGASVDNFLSLCREDKEHELDIEKRQQEERIHRA